MHDAFEIIAAIENEDLRAPLIRSLTADAESLDEAVFFAVNALSMQWSDTMRAELETMFSAKFSRLMEAMR